MAFSCLSPFLDVYSSCFSKLMLYVVGGSNRVSYIIPCSATATIMSTLDGAANANHHNSDSEDDLDYVPEGEEQGVTNTVLISVGSSQT